MFSVIHACLLEFFLLVHWELALYSRSEQRAFEYYPDIIHYLSSLLLLFHTLRSAYTHQFRAVGLSQRSVCCKLLNPFKPILWKLEPELQILCGALYCYLKVLNQKWRKTIFPFFIYYNFSSNSIFNLNFCVVLGKAIEKSDAKI